MYSHIKTESTEECLCEECVYEEQLALLIDKSLQDFKTFQPTTQTLPRGGKTEKSTFSIFQSTVGVG